ncbi:MAG: hypothetical protein AB7O96_10800 [Pseudobdellovibrionaceae bacterium]
MLKSSLYLFFTTTVFFFGTLVLAAKSQIVPIATNGTVSVMAQSKNRLFIGGAFTTAGQPSPAGNILLINKNGKLALPKEIKQNPNDIMTSLATESGFYIGGHRPAPNAVIPAPYFAFLKSDGTVEEYEIPSASRGGVYKMNEHKGQIYLFGSFYENEPIHESTMVLVFDPLTKKVGPAPFKATGWLGSWALDGDDLYFFGNHLVFNGKSYTGLGVYHFSTGVVEDLSSLVGQNSFVSSISIANGKMYLTGARLPLNAETAEFLEIDLATRKIMDWSPPGSIESAEIFGSTLVIKLEIEDYTGKPLQNILAYDLKTHNEIPLLADSAQLPKNGFPYDIKKQDNHLYIIGFFGDFIPALDVDMASGTVKALGESFRPSGLSQAVAQNSSQTLLAGNFSSLYSFRTGPLAIYDLEKHRLIKWNSQIPLSVGGGIHAMEASRDGKRLYFSGYFEHVLGQSRPFGNAAIDTNYLELLEWEAKLSDAGKTINSIAERNGNIILGGEFTRINGVNRNNFAEVDPLLAVPTDWNPSPSQPVYGVKYDSLSQILWMGGTFKTVEGKPRRGFAGFDVNGKLLSNTWTFELGENGGYDFVPAGDFIYTFGPNFWVDDVANDKILKLTVTNRNVENFATDLPASPYTLIPDGDSLIAVGYYKNSDKIIHGFAKRIDTSSGVSENWHSEFLKDKAPMSINKLNNGQGYGIGGWAQSGGFVKIVSE